jgi:murein L,D-transpeptidase YcbB/YkuD
MDLVTGGEPSWTEKLVKDLPTLKEGDDNFDVKTLRWNLGARDLAPAEQLDLMNTVFTPALTVQVKAFQASAGLAVDGVVGPATWPKLLRV